MPVTFTTKPAAPSETSLDSSIEDEITISWTDNSSGEDGYRVYRSTDGANFSQLSELSADVTSYTDNSLTDGKKYYYFIAAFTSSGESSGTSVSAVTILPRSEITSIDDSVGGELAVSWTKNDDSSNGSFEVERAPLVGRSWSTIATGLSTGTTSYTDTTINDATEYKYRITRDTGHARVISSDKPYRFFPRVDVV